MRPNLIIKAHFKTFNDKLKRSGQLHEVQYANYVDYMDREDAKMEAALDLAQDKNFDHYFSGERTLAYIGNPLKTDNVFNDEKLQLSEVEIKLLKHAFNDAQKNESPLWQIVYSFDNDFLKEKGYLSQDGKLNDAPIKEATRKGIEAFKKKMKLNDTTQWVAAIHYNTDNIHVHVAVVESETSRELITSGKYQGQRKAAIPRGIIKEMKSKFANHLINRTPELARISDLSRIAINGKIKSLTLKKETGIQRDLRRLVEQLPEDRRLWRYNMNAIKDQRHLIDHITYQLVHKHVPKEYQEFQYRIREEDAFRKEMYGDTKTSFADNREATLRTALGNALLSNLKEEFPKKPATTRRTSQDNLYVVSRNFVYNAKQVLRKTHQDYLNERKHRELQYEQEVERQY